MGRVGIESSCNLVKMEGLVKICCKCGRKLLDRCTCSSVRIVTQAQHEQYAALKEENNRLLSWLTFNEEIEMLQWENAKLKATMGVAANLAKSSVQFSVAQQCCGTKDGSI